MVEIFELIASAIATTYFTAMLSIIGLIILTVVAFRDLEARIRWKFIGVFCLALSIWIGYGGQLSLRDVLSHKYEFEIFEFVIILIFIFSCCFAFFMTILPGSGNFKPLFRVASLSVSAISVILFAIEKQEIVYSVEVEKSREQYEVLWKSTQRSAQSYKDDKCTFEKIYRDFDESAHSLNLLTGTCISIVAFDRAYSESIKVQDLEAVKKLQSILSVLQNDAHMTAIVQTLNESSLELSRLSAEFADVSRKQNPSRLPSQVFFPLVVLFIAGVALEAVNESRSAVAEVRKNGFIKSIKNLFRQFKRYLSGEADLESKQAEIGG